ncbi:phosphoesterase [Malaciobacter molluscorum LMG 25693]|uniref:Oligoribonuclease NrnB n=1 Tax=Malaciobacter molluscorum LMG 25693 TaxID=870501 RepID=A0A2G1DJY6_9BACT|nr:phosphoesterase [Malaciobacter molluscorum]AXX91435.1 oligoribonuclease NrnB [Malaciobacter molluscorum LMG 25693]PHO18818.1 phosphoesterase [Malaciobacter molluscorum LMG 25693]
MKLFHISHTDLDGYSCQLLTKQIFNQGIFFNANYGLEVKLTLKKVLELIKQENKEEEIFLLITDLNLTQQESKDLDKDITALKKENYNIKLQLLDHHASGQKSADNYEWYYLDISKCAAKITYEYLVKYYGGFAQNDVWINPLIKSVNAIDIWLDNETFNFEFGKVLLTMISKVREINNILFADLNRDFRLYLLKEAAKYINEENANIKLDDDIHKLKKQFLNTEGIDDTLDNLSAKYLVYSLDNIKDELTVFYKGHKGLLTYTLGSISIPANAFLKANPDYDFFIDVSKKGNASFRADGKVDVSYMAEKLANGGGHVNASGAKFEDFKETIDYLQVKNYIQEKLCSLEKI